MKRKSIIFLSVLFFVLSITTMSFATDYVKNMTNSVIDGANNLAENVRSGIGNAEDAVEDGASNLADDVRSGIGDAENFVEDGASDIGTAISDGARSTYNATRTTADMTTTNNNMTASVWTWVTIAIAAVVIVGLVWYYATQHNNNDNR